MLHVPLINTATETDDGYFSLLEHIRERFCAGAVLPVDKIQRARYAEIRAERLSIGRLMHAKYVHRLL